MPAELQTERQGGTLVLTIRDPGASPVLPEQVFTAGVEALSVAESDPDVRCIVLRGGGTHSCAESTLPLWADTPAATVDARRPVRDFAEALRVIPKPVIAGVEGMACGDSFWLAMACDLVVAAADAKFLPFPARPGVERGDTGFPLETLPRLSRHVWLEWMWLAEPLTAQQLQRLGLVNQVAGSGQAFEQALAWADRLAQGSAQALADTKEYAQRLESGALPPAP